FTPRLEHFGQINRYLWFFYFVFLFLGECLKANINVAIRVLNPKLPIHPGIVKVKTDLKSEIGITFLGNCLTLASGTLCVDVDQERRFLYVHSLDVKSQDTGESAQLIVNKFEKVLERIFE
ncbi:MAG: Na+/H+ antiporter subunit E, partial [Candidatus Omnitrophica bacterium]|nr:Na+/H+ antiporter subunit E [Candidatus Omnitrophota bacterium]